MGWLVRRMSVADVVTLGNGAVGFVAGVLAFHDPGLAARLVLLAAIFDAIDGILARRFGNTEAGPLLDAITDVVSFGVTPALLIVAVAEAEYGTLGTADPVVTAATLLTGAVYVLLAVVRTAMYSTHVDPEAMRPGVQNTLAATILAAAYLTDLAPPWALLVLLAILAVAMVAPLPYPKLRAGDAIVLGVVQIAAVAVPAAFGRIFPIAILVAALAYGIGAPWFYWGKDDETTVSRVD
jgi:CDP-diacylglycerol--serine O-phosphatidyltransferase